MQGSRALLGVDANGRLIGIGKNPIRDHRHPLVTKHFHKKHPLYQLLNRNTKKISYCCTKKIRAIIQSHNKKILNKAHTGIERKCNCQKSRKDKCPLDNNCQQIDVIYHVTTVVDQPNKYIGSTCYFKKRFLAHNHSFRLESSN